MFILRCNLTGSAERPPRRLRTACFKCGEHGPPDGPCSHPLAACLRLHRRAVQRSPRGYTRCAGRGTCWISKLPHRGGAAVVPAVPSRSSTATRPAMQVSARPRTAIIMLHPGRRRPWLASAAHVKCKLHMLSQAQGSRPGPPTDRNSRAFPHGKASPGRRGSLLPAWCTAVDLLHGPDALEAAATADGLQVTTHAYWRQPSLCCGRPGAALLRRRA